MVNKENNNLLEIIPFEDILVKKDLCEEDCRFKESFLCDKRYAEGLKETYFKQYNIKIYVYEFKNKNLRKIIDLLHNKELYHHRQGCYFALKSANFHCGESCGCECNSIRCWEFEKVPSRKQPHCINFFGLDIPEKYKSNNIAFILSNLLLKRGCYFLELFKKGDQNL